jgi:hypothetical protein
MAAQGTTVPKSFAFFAAVTVTPPDFTLDAGIYALEFVFTAGSVQLLKLLPDGATTVPITTPLTTTTYTPIQIPAGQYRLAVVTGPATVCIEKIDRARS